MKKDLCVIPECYVDTNLISCLLGGIGVNHQKGCTRVTGVMEKRLADRFAIGVIDADKVTPGYLAKLRKVAGLQHLCVYKSDIRPHYIITIHKAVEDFILDEAHKAGVSLSTYGLPDTLDALKKQTKKVGSDKDSRFKALFGKLEDVGEVAALKELLMYLRSEGYLAQEEQVVSILAGEDYV
ncbi:MAG: hypothetical protein IJ524_07195 [Bacteroidales bacterium]|nr:hypothetical protein [Bacteroidales bacterium]